MSISYGASHTKVFFGVFLFALVAIVVIMAIVLFQKSPVAEIRTFEDCVRAGNKIMESYPRQCSLPNGKFFVEQSLPETQVRK